MSSNADRIIFSMGGATHFNSAHNSDRAVATVKGAQHYSGIHNAGMTGRKTTYYFLTLTGVRGSTTNRSTLPINAIVEAIITT